MDEEYLPGFLCLYAANEAKCSADKALLHNKEELRIMSQQLESQVRNDLCISAMQLVMECTADNRETCWHGAPLRSSLPVTMFLYCRERLGWACSMYT